MFPNIYRLKKIRKTKNFAGINFRGRRILKNFAEKAKKRETAKVSDLKVAARFLYDSSKIFIRNCYRAEILANRDSPFYRADFSHMSTPFIIIIINEYLFRIKSIDADLKDLLYLLRTNVPYAIYHRLFEFFLTFSKYF